MRLREKRADVRGGFTLMEILVVVAIVVVLAGAAVPIYMKYLDDARRDTAKITVRTIEDTLKTFHVKEGAYPANLEALIQPPAGGGLPYFEQKDIIDPWG